MYGYAFSRAEGEFPTCSFQSLRHVVDCCVDIGGIDARDRAEETALRAQVITKVSSLPLSVLGAPYDTSHLRAVVEDARGGEARPSYPPSYPSTPSAAPLILRQGVCWIPEDVFNIHGVPWEVVDRSVGQRLRAHGATAACLGRRLARPAPVPAPWKGKGAGRGKGPVGPEKGGKGVGRGRRARGLGRAQASQAARRHFGRMVPLDIYI
eukprot:9493018-Pyramimonas_sp.AAC.1